MRSLALAAIVTLCAGTAHANEGPAPFVIDLRGFQRPVDVATTCVLAFAASGDAHRMLSQDAANWCINAALIVFRAFPKPPRCPPDTPTEE